MGVGDVGDIVVGVGVGMATQTQLHQGTVPHPFMHTHKHSRTDALGLRCGPQRRTVANTPVDRLPNGPLSRAAAHVITNSLDRTTDGLNEHSPESSAAQRAALATHTHRQRTNACHECATLRQLTHTIPVAGGVGADVGVEVGEDVAIAEAGAAMLQHTCRAVLQNAALCRCVATSDSTDSTRSIAAIAYLQCGAVRCGAVRCGRRAPAQRSWKFGSLSFPPTECTLR